MERHLQSDMTLNPNMIQHLKLSRPNGTIRGVFFTNAKSGKFEVLPIFSS